MTSAEIAQSLRTNFAGENLAAAGLAFLAADERSHFPAAILLLNTVCNELAGFWEGPVLASRAAKLENTYLPLIDRLANAISSGDRSRAHELSDTLASSLMNETR